MVIRETYVNESDIKTMSFNQPSQRRGDGTLIEETLSLANILTISGSQIQIKCTHEEYLEALEYLRRYRPCDGGCHE